jgi:Predicted membrane protein
VKIHVKSAGTRRNDTVKRKVQEYFFYFILYSVIGWFYEVFLEVVVYRWGFSNRGVLFGPYCVIYGTGALILIFSLGKLQKKRMYIGKLFITPILVFFGIIFVTTFVELIGSYIMELTTGNWMWDYRRFSFNFQGRIALNPSIRFGIGGMLFLYVLQPLFEKLTEKLPSKTFTVITGIIAMLFFTDVIITFLL